MIGLVDLKRQYACYRQELERAIAEVMAEVSFVGGEKLAAFETALRAYVSGECRVAADKNAQAMRSDFHAIGCSSGTDALFLVLMALGIGDGDEVIVPAYTFISTGEVVALLGARPVFIDVNPDTYVIDAEAVSEAVTAKTKAVIPVGLFGVLPDMDAITAVAAKHNIAVIEDAAQSFGAKYNERRSCHLAMFGCTSFFPAKPLGGAGDGGAIFTTSTTYAHKLRCLLNHGQSQRYYHDAVGINGRLDTIQAAILNVKLRHLDNELKARRLNAARYDEQLDKNRYTRQLIPSNVISAYAQYSLCCESKRMRTVLIERLKKHDIGYGIYYPIPLHLQRAFKSYGYKKGSLPVSEQLAETMLSIPVHPFLTAAEQDRVIAVVNDRA
ncbi:UDP-2-acetamido-2-deoxy-3-oxo-D-glucuronate aminotransferase [Spirochaetota bacterium]|nr:UDP-2-acetamido-2-deoxy-3-oxo-D-glucuronate aminotransferase [Spirochaetota bacterium]